VLLFPEATAPRPIRKGFNLQPEVLNGLEASQLSGCWASISVDVHTAIRQCPYDDGTSGLSSVPPQTAISCNLGPSSPCSECKQSADNHIMLKLSHHRRLPKMVPVSSQVFSISSQPFSRAILIAIHHSSASMVLPISRCPAPYRAQCDCHRLSSRLRSSV